MRFCSGLLLLVLCLTIETIVVNGHTVRRRDATGMGEVEKALNDFKDVKEPARISLDDEEADDSESWSNEDDNGDLPSDEELESESESQSFSEEDTIIDSDTESQQSTDADTETDTESQVPTDTDTDTESQGSTDADTDAGTDTESLPITDTDTDADVTTDIDADSQPETDTETDAGTDANSDATDADVNDDGAIVNDVAEESDNGSQATDEDVGGAVTVDEPPVVSVDRRRRSVVYSRVKRTSSTKESITWPNHIPYIFDPNFVASSIPKLRKVLDYLEEHLCVTFTHEPDYDGSETYFSEKGYETNAFINFTKTAKCIAHMGQGNGKGGKMVNPCFNYASMLHEVLHSLGSYHAQSFPFRDRYITMHTGNIIPSTKGNFRSLNASAKDINFNFFDSHSMMMYFPFVRMAFQGIPPIDFSYNGQETFNYIRPDMGELFGPFSYQSIISEMTKNYKCIEKFCDNKHLDCGVGYNGYVNQTCVCVCPHGYDPKTNCKEAINKGDDTLEWPDTAFTLLKGGEDCPRGFEDGTIEIEGFRNPVVRGPEVKTSGRKVYLETCSRKGPTGHTDFSKMTLGSYCILKHNQSDCEAPFEHKSFSLTSRRTTLDHVNADVVVNGTKLTINFCCTQSRKHDLPILLPTETAFRLTSMVTNMCQEVDGMWSLESSVDFRIKNPSISGGKMPFIRKSRYTLRQTACYYEPALYGCSQAINLEPGSPTASVTSPGFGDSRVANKRCYYTINAPKGSKIRITFETFDIHPEDHFLMKRFHQWQRSYRVKSDLKPSQMVSENNFMFIEYWASPSDGANHKGVKLVFDLLAPEDLCYDLENNGKDYAGAKEVTETYEKCLPWKDAVNCEDLSLENGNDMLQLINSGSSCRNPKGVMSLQPWCYIYINDTMCIRRYCDACNQLDPEDTLYDCPAKMAADPEFCKTSIERLGCFKSCGMTSPSYNKDEGKCSKPEVPSGLTDATLADEYSVGDQIAVTCNGVSSSIECTSLGWTALSQECVDETCMDASQLCQQTLALYPTMCQDERYSHIASRLCKKSCGQCEDTVTCQAPSAGEGVTNDADSVSLGGALTSSCQEGFYVSGGDSSRACSLAGELFGEPLQCQANPLPVDMNMVGIRNRRKQIPQRNAVLLDGEGWTVPFKGKITSWHYYSKASTTLGFLVYRKMSTGTKFKLVGYNELSSCISSWTATYQVPADQQIQVEKGDMIGVYNADMGVAFQACSVVPHKQIIGQKISAPTLAKLVAKPELQFRTMCAYISVGAHVEPVA